MSRAPSAVLIVSVALLRASPASAQVPESAAVLMPPLLVTETGFFEGFLELGLQNRSDATITAWGVRMRCAGEPSATRGTIIDDWISVERARRDGTGIDSDAVEPGQTRVRRQPGCGVKGRGQLPESVMLQLVVFDDGRWLGDPKLARTVFAGRARQRASWSETLAVIEDVMDSTSGHDALVTLMARLEPLVDSRHPNAASDTLGNVRRALDPTRPVQLAPDLWMENLFDEAKFQVEASARHVRPSPELVVPAPF